MIRLILLTLFAVSCYSLDSCQDIDKPLNPTSDCCGTHLASDDDLEISGDAAINQFPWLAIIEYSKESTTCTGSLITSIHVLTSAVCAHSEPIKVRLGEYNKTHSGPDCVIVKGKEICNDGAITIDIAAVKSHPEYKGVHDIGVIKLVNKVPYNEFIRPICLPTNDILLSPPSNLRFINAGWGTKPSGGNEQYVAKHYVTLPYFDLKKCQELYVNKITFKVVDSHLCAGGEKDLDTCRGDSGGPLMFKENGHYTLVGIVSFGPKRCGEEGVPSVYTKVYSYLDWINSAIAEL